MDILPGCLQIFLSIFYYPFIFIVTNLLLFLFLDNAFCGLFLPFNFIAGSHSAMSQGGLLAKALILSDLPKKFYLHILVHPPRLGGHSVLGLWCQCCVSTCAGPESYLERLMSCISAPRASVGAHQMFKRENLGAALQGRGFPTPSPFSWCALPSLQSPNTAQGSREMLFGWHKEVVVSVALEHLIQAVLSRFFL